MAKENYFGTIWRQFHRKIQTCVVYILSYWRCTRHGSVKYCYLGRFMASIKIGHATIMYTEMIHRPLSIWVIILYVKYFLCFVAFQFSLFELQRISFKYYLSSLSAIFRWLRFVLPGENVGYYLQKNDRIIRIFFFV